MKIAGKEVGGNFVREKGNVQRRICSRGAVIFERMGWHYRHKYTVYIKKEGCVERRSHYIAAPQRVMSTPNNSSGLLFFIWSKSDCWKVPILFPRRCEVECRIESIVRITTGLLNWAISAKCFVFYKSIYHFWLVLLAYWLL